MKRIDGSDIPEVEAIEFKRFVQMHRWTFAKTYAAFCPHEYVMRRDADWKEFNELGKFIWKNGFDAHYGKYTNKCFVDEEGGWYYFMFQEDFDEKTGSTTEAFTIINRASLKEWYLKKETSMFGEVLRWTRKPKETRGTFSGIYKQ